MTTFNKSRRNAPPGAVYVGRPSKWGNPFYLCATRGREQSLAEFRAYLRDRPWLVAAARAELAGRDLVCWCAPLACHADILAEVANGAEP